MTNTLKRRLKNLGEVEQLVMEHERARKARDFARSDALRAQLSEAGILVENTKEGVRWRRK